MGKSEKRQRAVLAVARVSHVERDLLRAAARREGISLSQFIRTAALRRAVVHCTGCNRECDGSCGQW